MQIIIKLVQTLNDSFYDQYTKTLLACMYLTAFGGFLRIGEIAPNSYACMDKVLQFEDANIVTNLDGSQSLDLAVRYCKGNLSKSPFFISIPMANSLALCPVQAFKIYINLRGNQRGPLFLNLKKMPVLRQQFATMLKFNLLLANLSPLQYKGHSFRIGAATSASAAGLDDDQIMKLGRWRSSAVMRYIRIPKHMSFKVAF